MDNIGYSFKLQQEIDNLRDYTEKLKDTYRKSEKLEVQKEQQIQELITLRENLKQQDEDLNKANKALDV